MSAKANVGDTVEVIEVVKEFQDVYKVGDRYVVTDVFEAFGDRGVEINLYEKHEFILYDHEFSVVERKEDA